MYVYTKHVLHIHLYFLFTNGQVLKVKLIETVVIYFVVDGETFVLPWYSIKLRIHNLQPCY